MNFKPYRRIPKREISITFMSGPLDGKKLAFAQPTLGEERTLTLGRREGSDIHMPFDSQVSRLHARLGCVSVPTTQSDSSPTAYVITFWLEDGGSRNGTFIEKQEEPINGRVSLRPGTLFRIGRTWLRLDVPLSYD
ncbi:MAG TPA: FHA domain-containing protein [Aggregatilineales bacterium]|jgi:pSer/pThr/pTyr-binding forkhead associated (FHA) protein|nr:FHA domain-containing protein [Aggregatilineales bacterium]